jgi:hypothetical protein
MQMRWKRLQSIHLPLNPDSGHRKWEDYNFASIFTISINNTDICWKQLFWTTIGSNNAGELKAASEYTPRTQPRCRQDIKNGRITALYWYLHKSYWYVMETIILNTYWMDNEGELKATLKYTHPLNPDSGHRKWEDYNSALIFTLQINKAYWYIL